MRAHAYSLSTYLKNRGDPKLRTLNKTAKKIKSGAIRWTGDAVLSLPLKCIKELLYAHLRLFLSTVYCICKLHVCLCTVYSAFILTKWCGSNLLKITLNISCNLINDRINLKCMQIIYFLVHFLSNPKKLENSFHDCIRQSGIFGSFSLPSNLNVLCRRFISITIKMNLYDLLECLRIFYSAV